LYAREHAQVAEVLLYGLGNLTGLQILFKASVQSSSWTFPFSPKKPGHLVKKGHDKKLIKTKINNTVYIKH
jgi:hypothetical protein